MNELLIEKLTAIMAASDLPDAMPADLNFEPIDVSPRAIKMRTILHIADQHQWHSAIVHYLQTRRTSYLSDLTDPQLEDLLQRMEGYVDAAETGCSLADCLPAH